MVTLAGAYQYKNVLLVTAIHILYVSLSWEKVYLAKCPIYKIGPYSKSKVDTSLK